MTNLTKRIGLFSAAVPIATMMATTPASAAPSIPNKNQLSQYVVNRDGWEGIRQTLYDYQAYAAAGTTLLTFFSQPLGQGTSVQGTGAKTLSDTNMNLAGQLPANQEFLVQSIEVQFFPTTPTVAAAMPAATGAVAAAVQVNDAYIFRRSGNLQFIIGSKPYLQEAPLMRFPAKTSFDVVAGFSDTTTAGAAQNNRVAFAQAAGRPYMLHPASLLLTSSQNFSITLNWPEGVQAITNPAKVGVVLDGFLYRRSQ